MASHHPGDLSDPSKTGHTGKTTFEFEQALIPQRQLQEYWRRK